MDFDQHRYHQDVIVALRDQPGGLPDNDLLRQYAVDLTMDERALRDRLTRMRRLWNQKSRGIDRGAAPVYARLKDRDDALRAQHGEAMFQPWWWRQQVDRAEAELRAESRRFADDLGRAYGAVGRLTRAQLAAIAARWPRLSQQGVDEAVRLAGLQVVDVVELPTSSGLSRAAYGELGRTLSRLGLPTLVQLLHPRPEPGGFRLLSTPTVALDAGTVARRAAEAERLADSPTVRIRKDALGLLQTALRQGVDLTTVALFQIVEQVQAGRAQQLADGLLVRIAVEVGLHQDDAQVLVASLPAGAGMPAVAPADRVRDLLENGQLHAARQAVAVLPADDPAAEQLATLVRNRTAEVARLVDGADAAVARHHEEEAERLLRAAARIAVDDDELSLRLARLAPPPPDDLVARPVDSGVRLTWAAPRTGADEVRYRVVRGERPPGGPNDGEVVGDRAETHLVDTTVPPGREVHYAVFASGGGDWSRPALARCRPLPPVSAVQLRAHGSEVSCGFRTHPATEAVHVRRTAGRPPGAPTDGVPVPATLTGFVDVDVPDGTEIHYRIVPVYRDENGAEVTGPPVVARTAAAATGPAYVQRLRVQLDPVDAETATVRLVWPTPAAGTVSVRRAELRPTWPPGTVVRRTELERYGEPVVGDRVQLGTETAVEATVPGGQFVYVPFTVDAAAGTAVVGDPVLAGVTEPVSDLAVRRAGTEVILAWVWPPAVSLVEVTFSPASGGPPLRRLVTRGQYAESGCRLPVAGTGGRVAVRTVSRSRDGDLYSAPVAARLDGAAATVEYHIDRVGGLFSRNRRLRVLVDQPCDGVELVLVAAPGVAMPSRPDQGVVLRQLTGLSLRPGAPSEVAFELPRRLARPYWLRCFVVRPAGVPVVDPIDEMKVA